MITDGTRIEGESVTMTFLSGTGEPLFTAYQEEEGALAAEVKKLQ